MHDLLIAAAFDLSGHEWDAGENSRFLNALLLGKAGDVRHGEASGALLAARSGRWAGSGCPRLRAERWRPAASGAYTLLAGRIFDGDELARRHGLPAGLDHSALYAALHATLEEDCDRWIDGNYAVIQWFPSERRVRLARSPISQYPLHVWRKGDRLAVSSIPRPLFALGAASTINDGYLADIMLLNFRDGESSWYRDLSRAPCGVVTTHDRQGTSRQRFWSLDAVEPVRFARDDDYVEAADELFRRSIRANLADVRRPALFLSGGLDSQAVASYLVAELPAGQILPCYTSVPMGGYVPDTEPGHFADESGHVRALAALYPQIQVEFLECAEASYDDGVDEMLLLGSWPLHNQFSAHWGHEGMRRAVAAQCDVIFSAVGGNIGFSYDGQTGLPTWLRTLRWARLARELGYVDDGRSFLRRLFRHAVRPHLPHGINRAIDRRAGVSNWPFGQWCALREDYARSSGALERACAMGQDINFSPHASAHAWRSEVIAPMMNEGPELRTAVALMHGIEERETVTYRPLLDFCLGVPEDQFLRCGQDRWLARRMLKGRVPEMVRTETRSGLQSADWPVRIERERAAIGGELAALACDRRVARMLDLERLATDFDAWPGSSASQVDHAQRISWGLSRAMSTARFVRHAEGRNAG